MTFLDLPIQIIGVPLDLGAARRGTDGGPSALRIAGLGQALQRLGYPLARERDIEVPAMETRDEGQRGMRYREEILQVCRQLREACSQALEARHFPLVLGGDHSIAMGSVAATRRHWHGKNHSIGLIWVDAHGDLNTPQTSPSGNIHGMPLAHLLGHGDPGFIDLCGDAGTLDPERVVLIGVRDLDPGERALIRELGLKAFTLRDIDELGMAEVSRRAIAIACRDSAGFHLSFDVDACDPSVIPGSGTLVAGGISFREAHLLLEHCADSGGLRAMDVVELNPFLDQANISAERTVALIRSALGQRIL
jgi:arginase